MISTTVNSLFEVVFALGLSLRSIFVFCIGHIAGSTYYVYVEQQADALARDQENMKKKAKGIISDAQYLSS